MLKFDWNILWTLIDLILFFILMKVFLFKPIKKTLDKRRELIEKQFEDADNVQKSANELKQQYQEQLDDVENEKKEILSQARQNAKKEYSRIVDKAQQDADKIKADAKKASDLECERARLSINEEIAKLAMETAEKVVGEKASEQIDKSIYDQFLNESSDKK